MSRPPLNPEKTASGIAVDPRTLERVIPESKRPDGSVRKQIRIRPGFTPQEDVGRFRGRNQTQMDAAALPQGYIIGWAPPPSSSSSSNANSGGGGKVLSKSAKKNAKRREKKDGRKEAIRDDWEDEEDGNTSTPMAKGGDGGVDRASKSRHTINQPNWALAAKADGEKGKLKGETAIDSKDDSASINDGLAKEFENLEVQ